MKKIFNLILITFMCFLLTGCGNVNLDLEKISTEIDTLKTDEFDILTASEEVASTEVFNDLIELYEYDLEELNIDSTNIEKMSFKVDLNNLPAYMIIKPVSGKENEVKEDINNYLNSFDNLNEKLETEYKGHLIYIFSEDNEKVLNAIKRAKKQIFGMLMEVDEESLEPLTGINPNDLDEYLIKNSVLTQSNSYYILKPKAGKEDSVKKAMDEYMEKLEQQWETYLPDQYELVKNRLEEEYGGYLIYIISTNNDIVLDSIKSYKK